MGIETKTKSATNGNAASPPLPGGLVTVEKLIDEIWKDSPKKPCAESVMRRARAKQIPSTRFGRCVYFNVPSVLTALASRHTVRAR